MYQNTILRFLIDQIMVKKKLRFLQKHSIRRLATTQKDLLVTLVLNRKPEQHHHSKLKNYKFLNKMHFIVMKLTNNKIIKTKIEKDHKVMKRKKNNFKLVFNKAKLATTLSSTCYVKK